MALPCATQNEMDEAAAKTALDAGVKVFAEGANMPLTANALELVEASDAVYAPGKASNAGGVAVPGLKMSQNAQRRYAGAETIDTDLRNIMGDIHDRVAGKGRSEDKINYCRGANIAGYRQLADAITAFGVI